MFVYWGKYVYKQKNMKTINMHAQYVLAICHVLFRGLLSVNNTSIIILILLS